MLGPIRPLSLALADACFVHWPVSPARVRATVPDWTEPDTVAGSAWVSAIALTIDRFDAFGVPLRENVETVALRTYVTTPDGQRAIHFLSADVNDRVAADAARTLFRVPTSHAHVDRRTRGDRTEVDARRRDGSGANLAVAFEPAGNPATTAPDTLASFLVDRERYVATGPLGTRLVGSVGHPPWTVQPADATVTDRTLLDAVGLDAPDEQSLVHYSPGLEMTLDAPRPL
ncbi:DUF2071 domain-containing protein [Halorubellus sp. JP-L1]|uniref:YqjF family protein n=1 Tax=Halorubellus sp. JP-L1 TaxID=2715753 RepID=UPI00140815A6|nr:DUF2071 domain-containing protein [Halorubellus sp. JP-L1]NHN42748.1 DUF2071 domain-containing protein [Halorubellus sp. JP-L1]